MRIIKRILAIVLVVFCLVGWIVSIREIPTAIDHWRFGDRSGSITTWILFDSVRVGLGRKLAME
jgi:hypothetical protein